MDPAAEVGEAAQAEQTALAQDLFEDGVAQLEAGDYIDASDLLSQCLAIKAASFGDQSVEAALVSVKYGAALLGCARQSATDDVLGAKGKAALQAPRIQNCVVASHHQRMQADPAGPSTSKGETAQEEDDDNTEDLELAFQVADLARVVFEKFSEREEVTPEVLTAALELLGDIQAENGQFDEAVAEYEKALAVVDACEGESLRHNAELHFKASLALEMAGDADAALKQVATAASQLKFLTKQKEAELQEHDAEHGPPGSKPAPAPAAAATSNEADAEMRGGDVAAQGTASASAAAEAAVVQNAEQGEAGTADAPRYNEAGEELMSPEEERTEIVAELKELREVAVEMDARKKELATLKQQNALAKQKLSELFGTVAGSSGAGASTSGGASTSSAAAPAPAAVGGSNSDAAGASTGPSAAAEPQASAGGSNAAVVDLGTLGRHQDQEQKHQNGQDKASAEPKTKRARITPAAVSSSAQAGTEATNALQSAPDPAQQ